MHIIASTLAVKCRMRLFIMRVWQELWVPQQVSRMRHKRNALRTLRRLNAQLSTSRNASHICAINKLAYATCNVQQQQQLSSYICCCCCTLKCLLKYAVEVAASFACGKINLNKFLCISYCYFLCIFFFSVTWQKSTIEATPRLLKTAKSSKCAKNVCWLYVLILFIVSWDVPAKRRSLISSRATASLCVCITSNWLI